MGAEQKRHHQRPLMLEPGRLFFVSRSGRQAFPAFLRVAGVAAVLAGIFSAEALALTRQEISARNQRLAVQRSGGLAPPVPLMPPAANGVSSGAVQGAGTGGDGGSLVVRLLGRVDAQDGEIRQLRGQLDQLTNDFQKQTADLSKKLEDLQFQMENSASHAKTAGKNIKEAAASSRSAGSSSGKASLQLAQEALQKKDYRQAQTQGQLALKKASGAGALVSAHYVLGQAYAGQKAYRQAAVSYFDAYKASPKSPTAPRALLGVAASMLALKDKHSACEAMHKFHSEFPKPAPREKNMAAAITRRGACGG